MNNGRAYVRVSSPCAKIERKCTISDKRMRDLNASPLSSSLLLIVTFAPFYVCACAKFAFHVDITFKTYRRVSVVLQGRIPKAV